MLIQGNAIENVVCKMSSISSRSQWVKQHDMDCCFYPWKCDTTKTEGTALTHQPPIAMNHMMALSHFGSAYWLASDVIFLPNTHLYIGPHSIHLCTCRRKNPLPRCRHFRKCNRCMYCPGLKMQVILQWHHINIMASQVTTGSVVCSTVYSVQAPVPLRIFRSNSKFDQNLQWSGLKSNVLITTKSCTRDDSNTVVTFAKFFCDRFSIFWIRALQILVEFRIRSKCR